MSTSVQCGKTRKREDFVLCCRQAMEFESCFDPITCTEIDPLYQWYLMSVGLADGLLYLCQNDTVTGSRDGLFLELVCDQCLPHFAISWHTCCRSRMLYFKDILNSICCFYSKYVSSFMGSLCTSISKTRVRFAFCF